ncbi:hypothetical protein OJ253_1353 [Cryptosporidium canis]|uniref:C-CAP/cofactor C-like domain-containing protein n=1 Tax=Cryptosporidium canis TaxID=195482 RepID=A0A9D5DNT7_9CRYT|nr:hypothetical protein OJ253_1353 [Cryptosporidium canis]
MSLACIKCISNRKVSYFNDQVSKEFKVDCVFNSSLKLFSSFQQIEISNTENSIICIGPVSTSVYINNCRNCVIAVTCRQIRIHDSHDLKIWLSCCTPPLLEKCFNIIFDIKKKDNTNFYMQFENHLQEVDMDTSEFLTECNFKVSDLSWLKIQNSPNWEFGKVCLEEYLSE